MTIDNEFKKVFLDGLRYLKNYDFINARKCFLISLNDSNYKDESLTELFQIEIRNGNYKRAREMLDTACDVDAMLLKKLYAKIEHVENNFERSKAYYNEIVDYAKYHNRSRLELGKLYKQTGDYDIARKMFETLCASHSYYFFAFVELIYLHFLEYDFLGAQKVLNEVDVSKLSLKDLQIYRKLSLCIRYFSGQLKSSDNVYSLEDDYMEYRLFDHSDDVLIGYLEKHRNQERKESKGCFFEYLDVKRLLTDVKGLIQDKNPNHVGYMDIYNLKLDSPIGYTEGSITTDLSVATIIGTKDIITMHPVSLSLDFDKEGMSTSKELMIKRAQGRIRK